MKAHLHDFGFFGIGDFQPDPRREQRFMQELPQTVKPIWENEDAYTRECFERLLASGRAPAEVAELFVYYVAGQANITRLTL